MTFDLTVKLGDLMQVGAIAGAVVSFVLKSNWDGEKNSTRLDALEAEMRKQTDILVRLAAGEERMNGLDHRITVMENKAA